MCKNVSLHLAYFTSISVFEVLDVFSCVPSTCKLGGIMMYVRDKERVVMLSIGCFDSCRQGQMQLRGIQESP